MKKIIIIEIILALTIVYIIKNIPGYKNTVLILRNDIKIEREEAFWKRWERFVYDQKVYICKRNIKYKWDLDRENIFLWWVKKNKSFF